MALKVITFTLIAGAIYLIYQNWKNRNSFGPKSAMTEGSASTGPQLSAKQRTEFADKWNR